MTENNDDSFSSSKAEVFEALGHPTRIRILQELASKPLTYSELKRAAGMESNGLLTFHLGKMRDLVRLNPEGNYALTDEGKEALRIVEASRKQAEGQTGQRPAFHLPHQKAILAGIVVVLIVLASFAVYQQEEIAALSLGASGNSGVLTFNASVNATSMSQGQTLRVEVSDRSNLYFTTRLPLLEMPGIWKNLSMGPSASFDNYPYGIGMYQGRYTLDNISSAASIKLYHAGVLLLSLNTCVRLLCHLRTAAEHQQLRGSQGLLDTRADDAAWRRVHARRASPVPPRGLHVSAQRDLWGHMELFYIEISSS